MKPDKTLLPTAWAKPLSLLLIFIYLVGIAGLLIPNTRELTATLTPVNLLLAFGLILCFETQINIRLILGLLFIGALGFGVEVAGVHTGNIFGHYFYKENLGPKWFEVPVILSLNWGMLVYCVHVILRHYGTWLGSVLGALVLVLYDLFLESFAIHFNLWAWEGSGIPPVKNYIAWFLIGFIFLLLFKFMVGTRKNIMTLPVFGIQLIFFIIMYFAVTFVN
jgi:uncharacterized membrane protein